MRRVFAALDRGMHRANAFVGGIALGRRARELPGDEPIRWREVRARSLARPEYLVRMLVLLLVPVVGIVVMVIRENNWSGHSMELSLMGAITGTLAILMLSTTAANSIVGERVNQTYELLLIFGAEWLMEHFAPASSYQYHRDYRPPSPGLYAVCVLSTLAIQLPLVSWLSMWCGMVCRTRIRAIAMALAMIVAWCAMPLMVVAAFQLDSPQNPWRWVAMLSPLTVPALNETNSFEYLSPESEWLPVLINAALYGAILGVLRWRCIANADRLLRR